MNTNGFEKLTKPKFMLQSMDLRQMEAFLIPTSDSQLLKLGSAAQSAATFFSIAEPTLERWNFT